MKLLVTGGLGYVGGRFAAAFASRADVDLLLTTRRAGAVAPWAPRARVAAVALEDESALRPLLAGVDVVVHLAGMNAAACRQAGVAAIAARERDVATLLLAANAQRVPRFIYVSTAHVYGSALAGVVDESTVPHPIHPYGASHLAAEELVRAAAARGEIEAVIARLSNTFGAPADATADCWTLAANDLCRQAVRTGRIKLQTAGLQRRDFVAMSEVCHALAHLCRAPVDAGRAITLNLGSGEATSVFEMAEHVAARVHARLGTRPPIETGPGLDGVGAGPLEFQVARLRASGFIPDPAAAGRELDQLVEFCVRERDST